MWPVLGFFVFFCASSTFLDLTTFILKILHLFLTAHVLYWGRDSKILGHL